MGPGNGNRSKQSKCVGTDHHSTEIPVCLVLGSGHCNSLQTTISCYGVQLQSSYISKYDETKYTRMRNHNLTR